MDAVHDAMNIQEQHFYDIPAQDLIEIFLDESYIHARCDMPDIESYTIDHYGEKDGRLVISLTAEVIVKLPDQIPKVLKKLVRDRHTMTSTVEWELEGKDTRVGHYRFAMSGVPAEIQGTHSIKPHGTNGSVNQLDIQVKSAIPLLGKTLCKFIGSEVKTGLTDEYDATLDYINKFYHDGIVKTVNS